MTLNPLIVLSLTLATEWVCAALLALGGTPPTAFHYVVAQATPVALLALSFFMSASGGLWPFVGFLYIWPGLAIVERLAPQDTKNNQATRRKVADANVEDDTMFRALTLLWVLVQPAILVGGAWCVTSRPQLPLSDHIGWILSCGTLLAIGVTVAHELFHKINKPLELWAGRLIMTFVSYGHFATDHHIHHKLVATPEDPVTARFNESLYAYLPRVIVGSAKGAWQIEKQRLNRLQLSLLHSWPLQGLVLSALWLCLCWFAFGVLGAVWFLSVSAVAIVLTETVEYIEHYGLRRRKLSKSAAAAGESAHHTSPTADESETPADSDNDQESIVDAAAAYEPVAPVHSWDTNRMPTSLMLVHLQRHSDHHCNALVRYHALETRSEAPEMITGYAGSIALAFIPPLWRWLVNPRVPAEQRVLATEN